MATEEERVFKSNIEEALTYDYSLISRKALVNFLIDKLERVIEDTLMKE